LQAVVKEFDVGSKKVTVFDGDYADIVDMVVETAKAPIEFNGSFSLFIPGGRSVVRALSSMPIDAFDSPRCTFAFVRNALAPTSARRQHLLNRKVNRTHSTYRRTGHSIK
jgi:hypothetical protein